MKAVQDLIPWKVIDLSLRPFPDLWSFNNSIHFDGDTWRCVLRCADYCMPSGKTVRSKNASPTGQQTKNAMIILDPASWKPIQIFKMNELDGYPRATTPHRGFEDMRLFRTDKGGLQGIAASLHLKREQHAGEFQHQPPEQVLLSFDGEYNIAGVQPIRGDWNTSQKNWVPFDACVAPRFLYSIEKGRMFDDRGPVHGDAAKVTPSTLVRTAPTESSLAPSSTREETLPSFPTSAPAPAPAPASVSVPPPAPSPPREESRPPTRKTMIRGGGDVRIVRGGRMKLDAGSTRSSAHPARSAQARGGDVRMMGTGRTRMPTYAGLRGGTQLCRVGDDAWLGIGHEMSFVKNKKMYWHTFYLVDSRGKMMAASEPMKLVPNGIEFAAGMAIDGDRVVVSFGVDDMECKIGETSLSAVMAILRPIER